MREKGMLRGEAPVHSVYSVLVVMVMKLVSSWKQTWLCTVDLIGKTTRTTAVVKVVVLLVLLMEVADPFDDGYLLQSGPKPSCLSFYPLYINSAMLEQ